MDALLSDKRWSRRQLLKGLFNGGAALATAGVAQATVVEPEWLKIEKHRVGSGDLGVRFAQITDLHFHRPNSLLKEVVESVRALKPEFICFTGDLVEKRHELPGAVEFLKALDCPIFGIPGNHDRTSRVSDTEFREAFASCGGMWLVNQVVQPTSKNICLLGYAHFLGNLGRVPEHFNVAMFHYPAWARRIRGLQADLALAGHSHGGQVRLPVIGAVITPRDTDGYEMGWYQTPVGPLYVNPGLGYTGIDLRFRCRPELTLFEV